jgi:hypothetical protein
MSHSSSSEHSSSSSLSLSDLCERCTWPLDHRYDDHCNCSSDQTDSVSGLTSGEGIDSTSDESYEQPIYQNQLESFQDEAQRQWIHLTICTCQPHCSTSHVVSFLK